MEKNKKVIRRFGIKSNSCDFEAELQERESQLHQIEKEVEASLNFQLSVSERSGSYDLVAEKLEKLSEQRKSVKSRLLEVKEGLRVKKSSKAAVENVEAKLMMFAKGWKKATVIVKKRLLRGLIDCLVFTHEGIKVYYHLDSPIPPAYADPSNKKAEDKKSSAFSKTTIYQLLKNALTPSNLSFGNASAFMNGAP